MSEMQENAWFPSRREARGVRHTASLCWLARPVRRVWDRGPLQPGTLPEGHQPIPLPAPAVEAVSRPGWSHSPLLRSGHWAPCRPCSPPPAYAAEPHGGQLAAACCLPAREAGPRLSEHSPQPLSLNKALNPSGPRAEGAPFTPGASGRDSQLGYQPPCWLRAAQSHIFHQLGFQKADDKDHELRTGLSLGAGESPGVGGRWAGKTQRPRPARRHLHALVGLPWPPQDGAVGALELGACRQCQTGLEGTEPCRPQGEPWLITYAPVA